MAESSVLEPKIVPAPEIVSEPDQDEVLTEDLLVEEISIDGMCGVY